MRSEGISAWTLVLVSVVVLLAIMLSIALFGTITQLENYMGFGALMMLLFQFCTLIAHAVRKRIPWTIRLYIEDR